MTIKFKCPQFEKGYVLKIKTKLAGKWVKCKECGTKFSIEKVISTTKSDTNAALHGDSKKAAIPITSEVNQIEINPEIKLSKPLRACHFCVSRNPETAFRCPSCEKVICERWLSDSSFSFWSGWKGNCPGCNASCAYFYCPN